MSGPDAFQDEMRRLLLGELGIDPLALDGDTADRLLAGRLDPADAPPGYAEVAVVLAAAAGPPTPGELTGAAAATETFVAMTRPHAGGRRGTGRRKPFGSRLAALAAAVPCVLLIGGVAAAATGTLPEAARRMVDSVKQAAHHEPARSAGERQDPGKVRSGGEGLDGAASVGHTGVSQEAHEGRSVPAAPTGPDATGAARSGHPATHLAGRDGVDSGKDSKTSQSSSATVQGSRTDEQPSQPRHSSNQRVLIRAQSESGARGIDVRRKESGSPGPEGGRR